VVEHFSQTSDLPYDRHHYRIVFKDGRSKVVESWDEVQEFWWNKRDMILDPPVIEVIDKPKKKSKGFI